MTSSRRVQAIPTRQTLMDIQALPLPGDVVLKMPYTWKQRISGQFLEFTVDYNNFGKFFTLAVRDYRGDELCKTALTYGVDALRMFQHIPEVTGIHIVPFDPAFRYLRVGIRTENFGNSIRLWLGVDS